MVECVRKFIVEINNSPGKILHKWSAYDRAECAQPARLTIVSRGVARRPKMGQGDEAAFWG